MKCLFIALLFVGLIPMQSCKSVSKIQNSIKKSEIKVAMIKALRWQEANPIFTTSPTDWTNGAYYTGVARAHEATGDDKFLSVLENMGINNNWLPAERFFHADDVAICYPYAYLKVIGNKKVNFLPTENIIKDHLYKPHTWKDGGSEKEQVILWWWCDALFMAPPLITAYSTIKKDTSYLDEMYKYYKQTYDLLYNKEEHLFARDTRFLWNGTNTDKKEANGKRIFWSRGNGWVFGGLALILDVMPKDYVHRSFFEELYKQMAIKIKVLQNEDGLWRTSLLSPESFNHGEVSGSGFFTFGLAWGINNGLLNKLDYESSVYKAWSALKNCQQESGKVGWVQNIGFDPRAATSDSWQNYGTGAFLLAGSEVFKMKPNK